MQETPRILVVDDEPVITGAACKILSAEGLDVDEAADAQSAAQRLHESRYRLVLCDLMLPGTNCLQVMTRIASHLSGTPVIVMTGYATIANAVRSFGHGAFDFLPKPFDAGELTGVVRRALLYTESAEWDAGAPGPDDRCVEDQGSAERLYTLGRHSWALLEADGSAAIGLGRTFGVLDEESVEAEFPAPGDEMLQGNRCVRITAGAHVYRVWSPLSGRVVETDPAGLRVATPGAWPAVCQKRLIRIVPSSLEDELRNLSTFADERCARPHRAGDEEER